MQNIIERLDTFRKKLIDLTARNSLLSSNLKPTNTSSLRFVDELPNQVFNYIIEEGNSMYLQAVPLPTEEEFWRLKSFDEETLKEKLSELDTEERKKLEEDLDEYLSRTAIDHAKSLNINTSYEVPIESPAGTTIGATAPPTIPTASSKSAEKHQDNQLQTLHFYEDLDAFAAKIRRFSNESLQEKGMNTLFLTFGYLEWKDVEHENKTHLAPLISVPVSISRETKKEVTARKRSSEGDLKTLSRKLYKIEYTGSDIATNEALKLKLESQGLILPEFKSEHDPEDYFSVINEEIISHNSTWKIHRYINLSKLDFSGSILYQDLDINNWLDGSLGNHPLIAQMLGERFENEPGDIDYELDANPELDVEAPIVMNADSSQHSAMIDAIRGKNMVIVGPPGTGKSQTITNLIAGFLHQQKKVLFVAQKSAALSVVKNRLNEIGIGEFCLDLHSTKKSHKKEIINDLESRLNGKYPNPKNVENKRNELNSLRKKIGDYCNFINKIQYVGLTSHQILSKVVKLQSKITVPIRQLTDLENLPDYSYISNCERIISAYFDSIETILETSQTIETHPWNFVNATSLGINDLETVTLLLEDLLESATKTKQIFHKLTGDKEDSSIVLNLKELQEIIKIDDFLSSESLDYHTVSTLIGKSNSTEATDPYFDNRKRKNDIDLKSLINNKEELFNKVLNDPYFENLNTQITQFKLNYEIEPILAKTLISDCESLQIDLEKYCQSFGSYLSKINITININSKEDFVIAHSLQEILHAMPIEYENLRDLKIIKNVSKSKNYIDELNKEIIELDDLAEPLTALFDITSLPNVSELSSIREAFIDKGFFSFLSSKLKKAKNEFQKFSIIGMPQTEEVIKYLGQLLLYAKKIESIEGNSKYKSILGPSFSVFSIDIIGIKEILKWYELILSTISINENKPSQLNSFVDQIFMIDVSEIDTFNDKNFLQKSNKIDDKFNQMLVNTPKLINGLEKKNSTSLISITEKIDKEAKNILDQQDQIMKSIDLVVRLSQEKSLSIDTLKQVFKNKEWKWEGFKNQYRDSHQSINKLLDNCKELAEKTSMEFMSKNDGFIEKLISLSTNAINSQESFKTWLDFIRSRGLIDKDEGLSKSLKIAKQHGENKKSMVLNIHKFRMYNHLAKKIMRENDIVGEFNEVQHNMAIKSFKVVDAELIKLNAKMIAAGLAKVDIPYGINDNMVRKKTERALIDYLISKPSARVSARDLIKRSSEALIAMKPCVMASPTTVAQYFKKESNIFDVVIIDEASQVRPEDSISAIARCSQAVIVGDPKQMPPSFLFRQGMENENVEVGDETDAESAESILDLAKEAFPMERMLRWHYRSQHQDLIAFSNSQFYNDKLVFFPSAVDKSPNLGIEYTFVSNATNSSRNTNREEASKVVDYVIDHMKNSTNKESIGIVAMNIYQQQEIEDLLEKKIDEEDDNRVAVYIESFANKETEKLFVKNLENVQGDERDVIVISFTYAKKEGATRLTQQFAQLYRDGWRRLNVLLTRAKKKMVVFSSFKYHEVDVNPGTTAKGVVALRAFLEFAQTSRLPTPYEITGREADSDFEIAVMDALREKEYSCIPQVGVSSYRIDVGVEHPDFPGEFIMGIECDGATYHSSKSARDRDRLRESILVSLGWRIERIWSTSWFNDSNSEIKIIVDKIEEIRKKDKKNRSPYVDTQEKEVVFLEEEEDTITQIEEMANEVEIQEQSKVSTEEKISKIDPEEQITKELIGLRPYIESDFPNILANNRLLTDEVIKALSISKPTSYEEYRSEIPFDVRRNINPEEEKSYLREVFEIIEQITK